MKQAVFSRRGEHATAHPGSQIDQEREDVNEKVAAKEATKNLVSLSAEQLQKNPLFQGVPPLPCWGRWKRRRCNRGPYRHSPRVCDLVDEYSTLQTQAAEGSSSINANSSWVVAPKLEDSEVDNIVIRKSDYAHSSLLAFASERALEACELEKLGRISDSREVQRGACVLGGKQSPLQFPQSMHQQDCTPQDSIANSLTGTASFEKKMSSPVDRLANVPTSLEKKTVSSETHNIAVPTDGSRVEAVPIRKDFALPTLVIELSRREKAEDFLIFKGSKIPSRPKRRPKAVEKALLECTPGNCLSNVSYYRYNVREKKAIKLKPRGLKAIESMDIYSDHQ